VLNGSLVNGGTISTKGLQHDGFITITNAASVAGVRPRYPADRDWTNPRHQPRQRRRLTLTNLSTSDGSRYNCYQAGRSRPADGNLSVNSLLSIGPSLGPATGRSRAPQRRRCFPVNYFAHYGEPGP